MASNFTKLNHKNFPLWRKRIRKSLSLEDKVIYFSLMALPQTDYRGLFEIEPDDLLKTGIKLDKVERAFNNLEKLGLIKYDEDNSIILIPEIVKNLKWGQNELISFFNYIKNEIDSFLTLDFINILENMRTANKQGEAGITHKALNLLDNFKLENKPLLEGYQRGIKGVGVALPIDIDKEKNKKRIRKDKELELEKDINKEKKALLKKDAEEVYKFYKDSIKGGARGTTIDRIYNIFLDDKEITKDMLMIAINNYIVEKKESGTTEFKFYKAPENFFSKANEVYKDYLGYDVRNRDKFLNEINKLDVKDINLKDKIANLKELYNKDLDNKTIEKAYNILNSKQDNIPF